MTTNGFILYQYSKHYLAICLVVLIRTIYCHYYSLKTFLCNAITYLFQTFENKKKIGRLGIEPRSPGLRSGAKTTQLPSVGFLTLPGIELQQQIVLARLSHTCVICDKENIIYTLKPHI